MNNHDGRYWRNNQRNVEEEREYFTHQNNYSRSGMNRPQNMHYSMHHRPLRNKNEPSKADQVDNWRIKSNQQRPALQNYPMPPHYFSSKHTNGTTYYYLKDPVLQQHEVSTEKSINTSSSNGASAQWRNHYQIPQQAQPAGPPAEKPSQNTRRNAPKTQPLPIYYHPDDKPSQTRESLYEPFLNPRDMEQGLEDGTLYEGVFKVGRMRLDCYVVTDNLDHDIYIGGNRDRNRAFNGDRVVVRLKDVEDVWKLKKERKERWRQNKRKQKSEETGEEIEEESDDSSYNEEDHKPKYCGEVVGIKYRTPGLSFSGTISIHRDGSNEIDPNNNKTKIAWFRPIDKKVPLLVIPPKLVPPDLIENPGYYSSHCFVAEFKDWRIFEQSPNIASYRLIGPKGAFETEKKCIIEDNDIVTHEFSKMALASLPRTPWVIPLQEYIKRRDLRTKRIFTIDPETAKDLDDAVHVEYLEEDVYEVGVHIADVSYFLKQNTPLDTEARERATSTYFIDGVIPMLPPLLSEELCSLNPGVDRLAFSVIWKMNSKGEILETWFGKTVIRSCAKLAYENAQDVIDGKNLSTNIKILNNQEPSSIESDILLLLKISKSLRETRYQSGALSLHSVKLQFGLDETGIPISVSVVELKEANRLIEEFMLLANISVAHRVLKSFPDETLLRRHEEPNEKRLEDFRLLTYKLGLDFDTSTAGSLQRSFDSIANDELKSVLQVIAIRPMKRAKYFCTGSLDISKYKHYALNEEIYTHFTSPIRRYADVIIHRQLYAAIRGKEGTEMSVYAKKRLKEIANDCNRKRESARNAQDMNNLLYLGVYLHNREIKQGPIHSKAMVISLRKKGFDIYLPEYGLEKSIGLDRLPIENAIFDKNRYILALFWKQGVPVTMHNEEKIYSENKKPNFEEEDSDDDEEEGGFRKRVSELGLDGEIQYPVKEIFNNETCMQELRMFSPIDVRIQVNMAISPPYINVYPINHFAGADDVKSEEEDG